MSLYTTTILADSPAAYWRLDETSGTAAADSSGNSKPLTYSGSYVLDKSGVVVSENDGSVQFTGGFATRSSAVITAVDNITLECWLKATDSSISTGNRCVLFLGAPGGAGYGLYLFSGLAVLLCAGVASFSFGYSPPVGTWVHLALVRSSGTWTFYVNGTVTGSTTTSTPNTPSAHTLLAANDTGGETLNATIDEVAIYSTALSAARIMVHYQVALATALFSGPVGNSPFITRKGE